MNRFGKIGAVIFLFIVVYLIFSQNYSLKKKYLDLKGNYDELQTRFDCIKRENENLKISEYQNKRNQEIIKNVRLDPTGALDIIEETLKNRGLRNPIMDLEKSLSERVDLVPHQPVLGGKMDISLQSVLSDKWVLAGYSDGHIAGLLLLDFKVSKGKIIWNVMDDAFDE